MIHAHTINGTPHALAQRVSIGGDVKSLQALYRLIEQAIRLGQARGPCDEVAELEVRRLGLETPKC
jgi:hypothetical protein